MDKKHTRRKKISDNAKATLLRGWIVGMCYFMMGFGTQAGDLGLSMLVVILVYLSYQNINLLLVGLLGLSPETVVVAGEPFGFATLYTLFYSAITGLTDKLRAIRTGSAAVCK